MCMNPTPPTSRRRRPARRHALACAALLSLYASAASGRPAPDDARAPPSVGAPGAAQSAPADDVIDNGVYVSDIERRTYRARYRPSDGSKWFEDDSGCSYPTVAEIVAAEMRAQDPIARRVRPDLLELVRGAAPGTLVDVTFVLARQRVAEVAEEVAALEGAAIEQAASRLHELLGLVAERRPAGSPAGPDDERDYLTPAEQVDLRTSRDRAREGLRRMRGDILDRARPLVAADQEPLLDALRALPRAIVFGTSVTLSAVSARLPAEALEELVRAHTEVAQTEILARYSVDLDVSVPVTGATTWWTAGYNGSSSTKVAVLDTGVDSSHPAFTVGSTNIVTNSAVYLSAASQQSDFADNASSTDDFHFHGTHCAGIVASNNSTYTGMAPGARLMNAKCGYRTTSGGGSLISSDIRSAGDWAATNGADVLSCSFGSGGTTNGTSTDALFFDAMADNLGIAVAVAAGNSGSGSGTLLTPADGFNVIAVANFDDKGTTSTSDDSLNSSSSRGPSSDGRLKPDLAAPGTNIGSTYAFWEGTTVDFVGATGTSMACPHVAGALAILEDAAVATYPEGAKALLLTNTRNSSPVSTSPDDNWGYGAMELSALYTNRAALYEGTLTSSGSRYVFLKPSSLAAGKRVTLAWTKRVVSNGSSTPTSSSNLLDLDLYVYDESDGSTQGSSISGVDSVEQVKLSSAVTTPVVKVYRYDASFPSGLSTQRIAVATEQTSSLSTVSAPDLSCSLSGVTSLVPGSTTFTVTATVTNSGGLKAQSPSVTLSLPSGYTLISGTNPRSLSTLAAGGSTAPTWTVQTSGTTGSYSLSASVSSSSYGESFSATSSSVAQTVDATPPTGSVSIAGGAATTTSTGVTLAFTATDTGSSVTKLRFREAGGSWPAFSTYSTSSPLTLSAPNGTKTVEAQFQDAVGNTSSTVSDTIVYDNVAPTGAFTIASGAAWTTSTAVTLSLAATDATSGVSDVRTSNNGSTWGAWTAYAATTPHTLTATDGTRSVYVQFRDTAGNVSGTVTESIGLDRAVPTGTVTIDSGAATTTSESVSLALTSSDATSGVADMRFSNDGSTWSSWQSAGSSASWSLTAGDATKTVYAQFRDGAGNVSSSKTDTILLDQTAPTGSVTIAGGASWSTAAAVTLSQTFVETGSGMADMRFSDDGSTWSSWQSAGGTASWTLPGVDGAKTVYAQFRDIAGNVSSTSTDDIGLDRVAPAGALTIEGGAPATSATDVSLGIDATDATSGPATMRFSTDGVSWTAWTPFAATSSIALIPGDGQRSVLAEVRDAAGNVSATLTDSILADRTPPAGAVTLAGDADYLRPLSELSADLSCDDGPEGSGAAGCRWSHDGGATWSPWTAESTGSIVIDLPDEYRDRVHEVLFQYHDAVGNVSQTVSDSIYVLPRDPQGLTGAKTVVGAIAAGGDLDEFDVDLEAGDLLDVKAIAKAPFRKADVAVVVDLYDPTGALVVAGERPAKPKKPQIRKFAAAVSGTYTLVLRGEGADAPTGMTYKLSTRLRAQKTRKVVGSGDIAAAGIPFTAAPGRVLKGVVRGEFDAPALLVGPDGSNVALTLIARRRGVFSIPATTLDGGFGTYELRVTPAAGAATTGASWKLVFAEPKRVKRVDETVAPF